MTSRPLPPRDWRGHGVHYALHALMGAALGFGLLGVPTVSLTGTALFLAYQTLEFCRRGDTPARDVKDFSLGWTAGVAAGIGWGWLCA